MELHLPFQTRIVFRPTDDGLSIIFDTERTERLLDNDFLNEKKHRELLIKEECLYEIIGETRKEIDCSDYGNGLIEVVGCIVDVTDSGCPGGALFDALIEDLMRGERLSWIPTGFYYFDGTSFQIFTDRETLDKWMRFDRCIHEHDFEIETDPDWDPIKKELTGLAELEEDLIECTLPTTGSGYFGYEIRDHFRHCFF